MKPTFFARRALLVLMIVFFLVPFALRGARKALETMRNDVKDWLPADFAETAELDWFREQFLGEQFVVVSWEGCTGSQDDESFMTLVDKFFPETPPSQRTPEAEPADRAELDAAEEPAEKFPARATRRTFLDERTGLYARQMRPQDVPPPEEFIGNRLELFATGDYHENWGGQHERWLKGRGDFWYYLTPAGELYEWRGGSSMLAGGLRVVRRLVTGGNRLEGRYVMSFGPVDGPWYYADPRRLAARLFKSVTTGPGVLVDLVRPGGSLENDLPEARRRLAGTLFGPDGKQTCLVVTLTDAGKHDMRRAIGRGILGKPRGQLLHMAEEAGLHGPPRPTLAPPPLSWWFAPSPTGLGPSLKLGGPPVDNVAIDEEGQVTLVRLVGLSLLLGLALIWLCFRSLSVTIMVFLVGGISAVGSVSAVFWTGSSVDAVLMSMPSLVYVLGLSGAVHIINYYREEVHDGGLRGAPERALGHGWRPCTLAALTTALGLVSLYASNILPIRKFGLYSALGVLGTLILLFTFLPAALQLWPPRRYRRKRPVEEADDTAVHRLVQGFWQHVGGWVVRRPTWVACGCGLVMAVATVGVLRLNTSVQLLKMFDADARIIRDYEWLEAHLGRLVPMELVVRVAPRAMRNEVPPEASPASTRPAEHRYKLNFLERMEIAGLVQQAVEQQFGDEGEGILGRAMLAATFAPPLPGPGGSLSQSGLRGGFSRRLEAHREELLASDYLRVDRDTGDELWRISLRLGALQDVDYGQFVGRLKGVVEPVMAGYAFREAILKSLDRQRGDRGFRGAKVYFAGAPFGKSRSAGSPYEAASKNKAWPDADAVLQTRLFAGTLWRLLVNAGVNVRDWHDPSFALPAKWPEVLAEHDCVVLLADHPQYELAQLQALGPRLIDARGHRFHATRPGDTAAAQGAAVSTIYTGLVPVVYKAQRTLLHSLIQSTFWAFVMIAFVMMLLLRSLRAGLLAMAPNVFPVVVIFGYMGWRGTLVDIGSMMTASVAMGVAVDDTIHFLTWFREALDKGLDRKQAILAAYSRCATAMTQTTAIGGLGLAIFALSTFTPTQRFGTLMLTLLLVALMGDLIFLPALLASPLGRVFRGEGRPGGQPARDEPSTALAPEPHAPLPALRSPADSGAPGEVRSLRKDASHRPRKH